VGDTGTRFNPDVAAFAMIVVTLFAPIEILHFRNIYDDSFVGPVLIAFLWTLWPSEGFQYQGLHFFDLMQFNLALPATILPAVFGYLVVRNLRGQPSPKLEFGIGLLSILPASLQGLLFLSLQLQDGITAYSGPIPIWLVAGFLLIRFFGSHNVEEDEWVSDGGLWQ
jgi:hypothetical protein